MADATPGPKPIPEAQGDTMIRCPFDPAQRRQEMVSRLMELRLLIPQFEEEKARLEGAISMLDEIGAPGPNREPKD